MSQSKWDDLKLFLYLAISVAALILSLNAPLSDSWLLLVGGCIGTFASSCLILDKRIGRKK